MSNEYLANKLRPSFNCRRSKVVEETNSRVVHLQASTALLLSGKLLRIVKMLQLFKRTPLSVWRSITSSFFAML